MNFMLSDHNYQPGHVEMFYGQGLVQLGYLEPSGDPAEGDYRASFTVNGEWRFRLNNPDNGMTLLDANDPGQLTPELENIIKSDGRFDGSKFDYHGTEVEIEWVNNNWFEVFVDVYQDGEWVEVTSEVDESFDVGPSIEEMIKALNAYIEAHSQEQE